jgi:hypothetical protein
MSGNHKQDLPPKGGYKKITIGKVPTWSPKRKFIPIKRINKYN